MADEVALGAAARTGTDRLRVRRVLFMMPALLFIVGLMEVYEPGPWPLFASTLLFALLQNFLPFYWYRLDSDLRAFARSRLMNIGVVGLGPLVIPVYLLRSRARGERLRALLRFAGFSLLLALAAVLGLFAGTFLPAA